MVVVIQHRVTTCQHGLGEEGGGGGGRYRTGREHVSIVWGGGDTEQRENMSA